MECRKNRASTRSRGFGMIEVILGIAVTMGLIVGGILIYTQASLSMATQETTRTAHGVVASVQGMVQNIRASDRATSLLTNDNLLAGTGFPLSESTKYVTNENYIKHRDKVIDLPYGGELSVLCVGPEFMVMDIFWPNTYMGNRICNRLALVNDQDRMTGVLGGNFRVGMSSCNLTDEQTSEYGSDFSMIYAHYFWDNPDGSEDVVIDKFIRSQDCDSGDL